MIGFGRQVRFITKGIQETSKKFFMDGNEGIIGMSNEEELKAMKEGYPVGDFKHIGQHNVGSIGHKTDLGRQLAEVVDTHLIDDTERADSKGLEGVVHINMGEDTAKITEDLRAAARSGAKMVVADSHSISLDTETLSEKMADQEPFEYQPSFRYQLKKSNQGAAMMMATAGMMSGVCGLGLSGRKAKPMRKCALPGCEVMHTHNGGYCKAEHCKEHQQRQKVKK